MRAPGRAAHMLTRAFHRLETRRLPRALGLVRGHAEIPRLRLTTVGRKSGQRRTVPLFYTRDGDRIIVIASYGGGDTHPAWWLNLRASGTGVVELGGEVYDVTAVLLEGEERERAWRAMARFRPSYDTYTARTTREIPVVALTPVIGS